MPQVVMSLKGVSPFRQGAQPFPRHWFISPWTSPWTSKHQQVVYSWNSFFIKGYFIFLSLATT